MAMSRQDDVTSCPQLTENTETMRNNEQMPVHVPQVTLNANGEIVVCEESLVIDTTAVVEGGGLQKPKPKMVPGPQSRKKWSFKETKKFYKVLNYVGTDFQLMQQFFPGRTRLSIKKKFLKEDKLNRTLVDKALKNPVEFNIESLKKELEEDVRKENEKKTKVKRKSTTTKKKTGNLSVFAQIYEPKEGEEECPTEPEKAQKLTELAERARVARIKSRELWRKDFFDKFTQREGKVFEELKKTIEEGLKNNLSPSEIGELHRFAYNELTVGQEKQKKDKREKVTPGRSNALNAANTSNLQCGPQETTQKKKKWRRRKK